MAGEADLDELMRAARAGDSAAYRNFLAMAGGRLRGFYRARLGNETEAEDLVQECLIALHEKRDTHDPRRPVAPWLMAIARYKLVDHFRRTGRRQEVGGIDADVAIAPDELAARDLEQLLSLLPETQSEAIRLTRIEGLTMAEASERTGVGVSALKVRVHRGMQTLRGAVDGEEE